MVAMGSNNDIVNGSPLCPTHAVVLFQDAETVQEWAMRINMILRTESQRPTNLLVILNPYGGARKARKIWRKKAQPVFLLAGALA